MLRRLFSLFFAPFFLICSGAAFADAIPQMKVRLQIHHVETSRWIFDYEFEKPISKIDFGPARGQFRSQSWKILSDGIKLKPEGRFEVADAGGARFSHLQLELNAYNAFPQGGYSPMNLFSDGGAAIYLNNFLGSIFVDQQEYAMQWQLQARGLGDELVITPPQNEARHYLYFGPAKPRILAGQLVVIDPATPAWTREVIEKTLPAMIETFTRRLGRSMQKISFLFAISPDQGEAFSIKGGAIDHQVTLRFSGTNIDQDSPQSRAFMEQLLAHELAHLWQQDVAGGGANPQSAWIHEGGAELLAIAGLQDSGIWTEERTQLVTQKLIDDCDKLNGDLKSYRGGYACGFKRQKTYGVDPFQLWGGLIETADQTKELYSETMLQTVLAKRFSIH